MTIGERIRKLRIQNNISQEELADKINVSRQTISKWELDIVSPDVYNISVLCKCFNVTTDYLINGDESKIYKRDKKSIIVLTIMIILGISIATTGIVLWALDDGKRHSADSVLIIPYEFWIIVLALVLFSVGIIYFVKKRNK